MPYIGDTYLPFLVNRDSSRSREMVERNYVGHKPTVDEVDVSLESGELNFLLKEDEHEGDLNLREQKDSVRRLLNSTPASNPFEVGDSRGFISVQDVGFTKEPRLDSLTGSMSFTYMDNKEYRPAYDVTVDSPPTDFNLGGYGGLIGLPADVEDPRIQPNDGSGTVPYQQLYNGGGMVVPWEHEGEGLGNNAGRSLYLESKDGKKHVWKTKNKIDFDDFDYIWLHFYIQKNKTGGQFEIEFPEHDKVYTYNEIGTHKVRLNTTFFSDSEVILRTNSPRGGTTGVRIWKIHCNDIPSINRQLVGIYGPEDHANVYQIEDDHSILFEYPEGEFASPEWNSRLKIFDADGNRRYEEGDLVSDGRIETGNFALDLSTGITYFWDLYPKASRPSGEYGTGPETSEWTRAGRLHNDMVETGDWYIEEFDGHKAVLGRADSDSFAVTAYRGLPFFEFKMNYESFAVGFDGAGDDYDIGSFLKFHVENGNAACMVGSRGTGVNFFMTRNYQQGHWSTSLSNEIISWNAISSYREDPRVRVGFVPRDVHYENHYQREPSFVEAAMMDVEVDKTLIDRDYL